MLADQGGLYVIRPSLFNLNPNADFPQVQTFSDLEMAHFDCSVHDRIIGISTMKHKTKLEEKEKPDSCERRGPMDFS